MLLTREELNATAHIHPQVVEFYRENRQPRQKFDIHVYRAHLRRRTEATLARLGPAPEKIVEQYHDIQMRDGSSSSLKVFKPSSGPPGPLMVLCFGGGFVAGDHDQLTEMARISVQLFGATVVAVSYRLAPEYKFPVQQHDCWDSVHWIADNATGEILASAPSKGFVLGGISAGASITASLSRAFQEAKLAHPLTGQWLAAPSIMDDRSCPEYRSWWISHHQNANAPGLSREVGAVMREAVDWDSSSALRYAVKAKTPMSGQPRTYTQVCGLDLLRDDGLIYDEMLKNAGIAVRLDLYPGCPHVHWSQMRGTEIANKALIDTVVGLGWLLEMDVSREQAAAALNLPL